MQEKDFIEIPTNIQQLISVDQAWHYGIIPCSSDADVLKLYIDKEKTSENVCEELEMLFGKTIELIPSETDIINKTLGRLYRKGKRSHAARTVSAKGQTENLIYELIREANAIDSSDIHMESYEEQCRIRMRIDGKLVERYILSRDDYPALVNKIKITANLDIAEKRLPQDGRIFFSEGDEKFDIRVSILPSLHGEKVVMRLLSKDATNIEISSLGFNDDQLSLYLEGIKKPHGIVLISGPTGSGKTTTLYATLKILNKEETNILTIEDPIEYTLDGINQVQLKEKIGLTFASALRTFLRQDPDVIMLGEIRDSETAQMAVRAALTGHLVLSTIHTNSAWGTISRLIDMGVPSFLLANTINLSVAQRLVRNLCPDCKKEKPFDITLYPKNFKAPRTVKTHYTPKGCEKCFFTGYKGRKAVYEIIAIDNDLAEEIKKGTHDITSTLSKKGIKRLYDAAFELFENGKTSLEEVYALLMSNY
jgi:type IV pilus assembly protein PilB